MQWTLKESQKEKKILYCMYYNFHGITSVLKCLWNIFILNDALRLENKSLTIHSWFCDLGSWYCYCDRETYIFYKILNSIAQLNSVNHSQSSLQLNYIIVYMIAIYCWQARAQVPVQRTIKLILIIKLHEWSKSVLQKCWISLLSMPSI